MTLEVLYVDDEPGLLEIGKEFLEQSGQLHVTICETPSDAIKLLVANKFDVIISDYQMPETNGVEFLMDIRANFNGIPFIIFTGKSREDVVIMALNAGVSRYLQKIGDPKSMFAELEHAILTLGFSAKVKILLEDEQRLSSLIIDNLPGIFYMYSYPDVKLIRWNKRHETLLGFSAEELRCRPVLEFHVPECRDRVTAAIEEVMTNGSGSVKSIVVAKDGTKIPMFFTGNRFDTGKELFFIGSGIELDRIKE